MTENTLQIAIFFVKKEWILTGNKTYYWCNHLKHNQHFRLSYPVVGINNDIRPLTIFSEALSEE
jgi:hypothetical protein